MKEVSDDSEQMGSLATMSARVLADARRSFGGVDATLLEQEVHEVVALLWTESTKVTAFIPVLALRDLRERLRGDLQPPQA